MRRPSACAFFMLQNKVDNLLMPKRIALSLLVLLILAALPAPSQPNPKQRADTAAITPWLFAGFKGNGEQGVYYAISQDGYHWTIANQDRPVFHQNQPNELMRDPFLQRGPDATFHLVWTWSWNTPTILGHSTSTDLIHWTPHQQLNVLANEPAALNAWAPALYYEPDHKRWLLFWSSTIPGRFSGDNILIFKDERKTPLKKILQTAKGPTMEGPWTNISSPISEPWSEGAAIIPVHGGFLAYYDHYRNPQHYGALFTSDFKTWTDATNQITFPAKLRHGSFLPITDAEYNRINNLQQP